MTVNIPIVTTYLRCTTHFMPHNPGCLVLLGSPVTCLDQKVYIEILTQNETNETQKGTFGSVSFETAKCLISRQDYLVQFSLKPLFPLI